MEFFQTSTGNLLFYERKAGVRHHVALSVVGTDRLLESPYIRAKFAQERDVLRLEAFQRLHDSVALKAGARAFLERYPHSLHRARVDKLLEGLGAH